MAQERMGVCRWWAGLLPLLVAATMGQDAEVPTGEAFDLIPGEYLFRALVDGSVLCEDKEDNGQIVARAKAGSGCTFLVEKPADNAMRFIRSKESGKYLFESDAGGQPIRAGFDHSQDAPSSAQFEFTKLKPGDDSDQTFRIQVMGDGQFVRVDASQDPEVEADHKLSARGGQDTIQSHFMLSRITDNNQRPHSPAQMSAKSPVIGFRHVIGRRGNATTLQPVIMVEHSEACVVLCNTIPGCAAAVFQKSTGRCSTYNEHGASQFKAAAGSDAFIRNKLPQKVALPLTLNGHNASAVACTQKGLSLCPVSRACPDGPLSAPFGGASEGAAWLAVSDWAHAWVSVGDVDASATLCQVGAKDGASWGRTRDPPEAARADHALCCDGSDDLCYKVNWKRACPEGMQPDGRSDVSCTAPEDRSLSGEDPKRVQWIRENLATPAQKAEWAAATGHSWPMVVSACDGSDQVAPPKPVRQAPEPAIHALARQQCTAPEPDANYKGKLLKKVAGKHIGQCCEACLLEPACERYVLVPSAGCFLKSAVSGALLVEGSFQGYASGMLLRGMPANSTRSPTSAEEAAVISEYSVVPESRLKAFQLSPATLKPTLTACASQCSAAEGCLSFNYRQSSTVCQLSSVGRADRLGGRAVLTPAVDTNYYEKQPVVPKPAAPIPESPESVELKISVEAATEAKASLVEAQQRHNQLEQQLRTAQASLEAAELQKVELERAVESDEDKVKTSQSETIAARKQADESRTDVDTVKIPAQQESADQESKATLARKVSAGKEALSLNKKTVKNSELAHTKQTLQATKEAVKTIQDLHKQVAGIEHKVSKDHTATEGAASEIALASQQAAVATKQAESLKAGVDAMSNKMRELGLELKAEATKANSEVGLETTKLMDAIDEEATAKRALKTSEQQAAKASGQQTALQTKQRQQLQSAQGELATAQSQLERFGADLSSSNDTLRESKLRVHSVQQQLNKAQAEQVKAAQHAAQASSKVASAEATRFEKMSAQETAVAGVATGEAMEEAARQAVEAVTTEKHAAVDYAHSIVEDAMGEVGAVREQRRSDKKMLVHEENRHASTEAHLKQFVDVTMPKVDLLVKKAAATVDERTSLVGSEQKEQHEAQQQFETLKSAVEHAKTEASTRAERAKQLGASLAEARIEVSAGTNNVLKSQAKVASAEREVEQFKAQNDDRIESEGKLQAKLDEAKLAERAQEGVIEKDQLAEQEQQDKLAIVSARLARASNSSRGLMNEVRQRKLSVLSITAQHQDVLNKASQMKDQLQKATEEASAQTLEVRALSDRLTRAKSDLQQAQDAIKHAEQAKQSLEMKLASEAAASRSAALAVEEAKAKSNEAADTAQLASAEYVTEKKQYNARQGMVKQASEESNTAHNSAMKMSLKARSMQQDVTDKVGALQALYHRFSKATEAEENAVSDAKSSETRREQEVQAAARAEHLLELKQLTTDSLSKRLDNAAHHMKAEKLMSSRVGEEALDLHDKASTASHAAARQAEQLDLAAEEAHQKRVDARTARQDMDQFMLAGVENSTESDLAHARAQARTTEREARSRAQVKLAAATREVEAARGQQEREQEQMERVKNETDSASIEALKESQEADYRSEALLERADKEAKRVKTNSTQSDVEILRAQEAQQRRQEQADLKAAREFAAAAIKVAEADANSTRAAAELNATAAAQQQKDATTAARKAQVELKRIRTQALVKAELSRQQAEQGAESKERGAHADASDLVRAAKQEAEGIRSRALESAQQVQETANKQVEQLRPEEEQPEVDSSAVIEATLSKAREDAAQTRKKGEESASSTVLDAQAKAADRTRSSTVKSSETIAAADSIAESTVDAAKEEAGEAIQKAKDGCDGPTCDTLGESGPSPADDVKLAMQTATAAWQAAKQHMEELKQSSKGHVTTAASSQAEAESAREAARVAAANLQATEAHLATLQQQYQASRQETSAAMEARYAQEDSSAKAEAAAQHEHSLLEHAQQVEEAMRSELQQGNQEANTVKTEQAELILKATELQAVAKAADGFLLKSQQQAARERALVLKSGAASREAQEELASRQNAADKAELKLTSAQHAVALSSEQKKKATENLDQLKHTLQAAAAEVSNLEAQVVLAKQQEEVRASQVEEYTTLSSKAQIGASTAVKQVENAKLELRNKLAAQSRVNQELAVAKVAVAQAQKQIKQAAAITAADRDKLQALKDAEGHVLQKKAALAEQIMVGKGKLEQASTSQEEAEELLEQRKALEQASKVAETNLQRALDATKDQQEQQLQLVASKQQLTNEARTELQHSQASVLKAQGYLQRAQSELHSKEEDRVAEEKDKVKAEQQVESSQLGVDAARGHLASIDLSLQRAKQALKDDKAKVDQTEARFDTKINQANDLVDHQAKRVQHLEVVARQGKIATEDASETWRKIAQVADKSTSHASESRKSVTELFEQANTASKQESAAAVAEAQLRQKVQAAEQTAAEATAQQAALQERLSKSADGAALVSKMKENDDLEKKIAAAVLEVQQAKAARTAAQAQASAIEGYQSRVAGITRTFDQRAAAAASKASQVAALSRQVQLQTMGSRLAEASSTSSATTTQKTTVAVKKVLGKAEQLEARVQADLQKSLAASSGATAEHRESELGLKQATEELSDKSRQSESAKQATLVAQQQLSRADGELKSAKLEQSKREVDLKDDGIALSLKNGEMTSEAREVARLRASVAAAEEEVQARAAASEQAEEKATKAREHLNRVEGVLQEGSEVVNLDVGSNESELFLG